MRKIKKELETISSFCEVRAVYSTKIPAKNRTKIGNPDDLFDHVKWFYMDSGFMEQKEVFTCVFLDKANKVLAVAKISEGSVSATVVDIPYIFRLALLANASGIVLCHNHPSGNLTPSEADKKITRTIFEAGKLLNIEVIDHLIITTDSYTSFRNEGLI